MKMSNDPAFLMYSKDWLTKTSELSHKAKGVYIDLLCYQHQNDGIPNDTKTLARVVGMTAKEFSPVWGELHLKFMLGDNGRLYNSKLSKVISEREEFSKKKQILGIYGAWLKKLDQPFAIIRAIKQGFKIEDFSDVSIPELKAKIEAHLQAMLEAQLQHIGDVSEDVIGIFSKTTGESIKVIPGHKRNPEHRLSDPRAALLNENEFLESVKSQFGIDDAELDFRLKQFGFKRQAESTLYSDVGQIKADFQYFNGNWSQNRYKSEDRNPANRKSRPNQILTDGQNALMDAILDGKVEMK